MDDVEFRLLGAVGVWRDGQRLGPATAQQRSVLASLLLEPDRAVSVERLINTLWGSKPPASARNAVQGHVSRLRRLLTPLAGVEVRTSAQGYCLAADPHRVDLHRFRDLVREARQLEPAKARDRLETALAEWHGPALTGVAGRWLPDIVSPALDEERLSAIEELSALDVNASRYEEVIGRLSALVTEHPLRERLVFLLLTALHHGGRRTDALTLFRTVRQRFVEELGIEPGEELQRAHQNILRGQSPPAGTRSSGMATPRQLPPDIEHFTGREAELASMGDALPETGQALSRATPIQLVTGTGGVGKTSLAVHWAHRMRDRFPDGQLHADLRGFGPTGSPVPPTDVVRMFLEALGVPDSRIPSTLESRVGLYRSLLADRSVLVVLDNARDADQIRPLLPGSPGSLVLITSRDALNGLVAAEGARPMRLNPFSAAEARDLIIRRLGAASVAAEREAIDGLISVCAGLPLTLTIMAARAIAQPGLPLAALLPDRGDLDGELDAFEGDDARSDLRTVFSWSHRALSEEGARLFRLLGLHEGATSTIAAAASLTGTPLSVARRSLVELARAHLTVERAPGRHSRHDLLWAYARELVHVHDTGTARQEALHRLLDHYLHTALLGDQQLNRHHQIPLAVAPARDGVTVTMLADRRQALAWFRYEHEALVAAVAQAARAGLDTHVWQLARATRTFLYQQGHFHEQEAVHRTALEVAERTSDPEAQAYCHFGLGQAQVRLQRHEDGRAHLRTALELYSEMNNKIGQAVVHTQLSVVEGFADHSAAALHHNELALELCRAAGHRAGEAMALNNAGWYLARLGQHRQALSRCAEALTVLQGLGDTMGEAAALDSLGYIHNSLGQHEQAISYYKRALRKREGRERVYQAETLPQLAEAQLAAGRPAEARDTLLQALEQLGQFASHDADAVRARLREVEELLTSRA